MRLKDEGVYVKELDRSLGEAAVDSTARRGKSGVGVLKLQAEGLGHRTGRPGGFLLRLVVDHRLPGDIGALVVEIDQPVRTKLLDESPDLAANGDSIAPLAPLSPLSMFSMLSHGETPG